MKFVATDMSGRDGYRSMWDTMYGQCDAIVFVVDSSDRMRFAVVKDELDMLLRHPDVASRSEIPILFVANKMTEPDACCASTVAGALQLHEHVGPDRPWRLTGADASANPGHPAEDGLDEAMEWLTELVRTLIIRQPRWSLWPYIYIYIAIYSPKLYYIQVL